MHWERDCEEQNISTLGNCILVQQLLLAERSAAKWPVWFDSAKVAAYQSILIWENYIVLPF